MMKPFALLLPLVLFGSSSYTVLSFPLIRGRDVASQGTFGVSTTTRLAPLSFTATATDTATREQTDNGVLEDLGIHMPFGLRQTVMKNLDTIPKRFWILDNSGSMAIMDGHNILAGVNGCCSRWQEVQETVNCHSQLSAALGAPTDFRLLNPPATKGGLWKGPHKFRVGYGRHGHKDTRRAKSILDRTEPKGMTPLPTCIKQVEQEIRQMAPVLEANGQKACLVLATDGCNYNLQNIGPGHQHEAEEERQQELLQALKSLENLPVCVVIRLCTDYQPLVDFFNGLDTQLDLDLDVIDDHRAEALEVKQCNPWLNYALVLHRLREMGQDNRLFDLIDERALTKEEIRDFCVLLFGQKANLPTDNWSAFVDKIDQFQCGERPHWEPLSKAMTPWIDVSELALLE